MTTTEIVTPKELGKPRGPDDIVMINDCKDYLLKELNDSELKEFMEEVEAEIKIRNCTQRRYSNYMCAKQQFIFQFRNELDKELAKIKEQFDNNVNSLRRQQIKEPVEENIFDETEADETESSEESEEPKKPAKTLAASKHNPKCNSKPKPKPRGRPKKS